MTLVETSFASSLSSRARLLIPSAFASVRSLQLGAGCQGMSRSGTSQTPRLPLVLIVGVPGLVLRVRRVGVRRISRASIRVSPFSPHCLRIKVLHHSCRRFLIAPFVAVLRSGLECVQFGRLSAVSRSTSHLSSGFSPTRLRLVRSVGCCSILMGILPKMYTTRPGRRYPRHGRHQREGDAPLVCS